MGNHWLQRRLFTCTRCGERYTHDRAYEHHCFLCPERPLTNKQRLQQILMSGKVYAPAMEGTR